MHGSLLPLVLLFFHQALIARRGGLLRFRSNATLRSSSEQSRPAGYRGSQAETRGRPRGRNSRESALLPRPLSCPSRAPDRGRRTASRQPGGRGAPVRRSPGAFGTVPGRREKSVGKTLGGGRSGLVFPSQGGKPISLRAVGPSRAAQAVDGRVGGGPGRFTGPAVVQLEPTRQCRTHRQTHLTDPKKTGCNLSSAV